MSTIVVFSKDRPMQLHAYLESLLKFSECTEEQIYVLYREVLPICYNRVKRMFPDVHWITESNFFSQLKDIVDGAEEFIMFGCDDVVFVDQFSLVDMESCLKRNGDVFGFSLRLGSNIKPLPKKIKCENDIYFWDWTENKGHYGYPWELDCTLYRKEDVIDILHKIGDAKSPNYLEAIPEENPVLYITRKQLASYKEKGKAVVITVNRVQNSHPNSVDDSQNTDIISLFIKYHFAKQKLDVSQIARKEHHNIHVGSEYFILTPDEKSCSVEHKNFLGKIRQLIQNFRYLCEDDLYDRMRQFEKDNIVNVRLHAFAHDSEHVRVLGPEQTVQHILKENKSFCRFGDGEFSLMQGENIAFQSYDPQLALALWEIFSIQNDRIDIGVPYQQFDLPDTYNEWVKEFYYTSGKWIRSFLYRYLPRDRELYIDTGFNQVYQTYKDMHFADYYRKICELFKGKQLTVIVGEGVLEKLRYNIFAVAESVEYQYESSQNAYQNYSKILKRALKIKRERTVCVILGPTAKVLIRDLTEAGYVAWDIGHLAKDYNAYRNKEDRTRASIGKFYAPD